MTCPTLARAIKVIAAHREKPAEYSRPQSPKPQMTNSKVTTEKFPDLSGITLSSETAKRKTFLLQKR